MDTKRHSTFFFCKLLPIFINCFPPPNVLHFGPNINLSDTESICKFPRITPITSSSDDLPAPTIPTSAFYLPPSSQIITNSHSASNLQPLIRSLLSLSSPSLLSVKAAIWSWWRHSSRTNKPLSPSHHYNLLQRKIRDPKSRHASSLVFLGNGCSLIFHLPLHRILSFMTLLCLSPSSCCLVFSHNTTYYSLLLTDPFRGLSSLLLPLIPGTNVATLLLKLHAIPVSFALTPVTSVKLLQT